MSESKQNQFGLYRQSYTGSKSFGSVIYDKPYLISTHKTVDLAYVAYHYQLSINSYHDYFVREIK